MKTQVNSFKISSFPKILSLKLPGNSWGNLGVQFGDNLALIFERRDLNFVQKNHPAPMICTHSYVRT